MDYLKRSIQLFMGMLLLCSMTAVATANEIEIGDDHYLIFYHSDALGSPLAVTNHNGNVLWYEHSEPYGKTMTRVSQTGQEILNDRVGTRKGYTGHLNDTAADLVYMKARYYDPQIGRFYSNDPVGFVDSRLDSFNRYAYVGASPYNRIDPNGQFWWEAPDLIALTMEAGEVLAAGGAAVVGYVTDNQALQDVGQEALAEELPDVGVAVAGVVLPGSAAALARAKKAAGVTKGGPKSPHIDPKDVANKTPDQIDQLAKDKGLLPKGPDPKSGRGAYVDPTTGNQRVLCHTNCSNPHGHVNNSQGQRLDLDGNVVAPESPAAHLPINYP